MSSLFPFALANAFDLSAPTPGSADTIHVTSSYTVNNGDILDLAGNVGFKLEVRNHASLTLDINGTVNLDGGDQHRVTGVLTSISTHGDADVTVGATGALSVTGDAFDAIVAGAVMQADGSTFRNFGTVQVSALKGTAAGAVANLTQGALLVNGGVMTVEAKIAYGLYLDDPTGQAVNNQDLTVTGQQAAGIISFRPGALGYNDGHIRVAGAGTGSFAAGVVMQGGAFTNDGSIHVTGQNQVAGVEMLGLTDFHNNGHILAEAHGGHPSIGLLFSSDAGGVVANNGVIRGDFAAATPDVLGSFAASNDIIINNGKLDGAVSMGGGSDGISNVGRITGDIDLGDGGDILISNRGHLGGDVMGGLGNDNIEGSRAGDTLYGDEQDDSAGGGDDILRGMKGDDVLRAGQGTDTLIGGEGSDTLYGGGADDLFKFTKLTDSTPGSADLLADLTMFDIIDLHLIDADTTGGSPGDQAFHRVGAFSGAAGELTVTYDSGTDLTTVAGDVDGDGVADLVIHIAGDQHSYSEFIL